MLLERLIYGFCFLSFSLLALSASEVSCSESVSDEEAKKKQAVSDFSDDMYAENNFSAPFIRKIDISAELFNSKKKHDGHIHTLIPITGDSSRLSLLYLTPSITYVNKRMTYNAGLGFRKTNASENFLWGGNVFYDYDVKGKNKRISEGVEFSVPYVDFTANFYQGMSSWKLSKTEHMHYEKTANGLDAMLKITLPAYPQLVLGTRYFHWKGEAVNLHHDKKYTKSPKGIAYSIEYKPVPLVNFVLIKTYKNHSRKNNTDLFIRFVYDFNQSFSYQTKFSWLPRQKTFSGGLYKLSEREYGIVLDLKKKVPVLPLSSQVKFFDTSGDDQKQSEQLEKQKTQSGKFREDLEQQQEQKQQEQKQQEQQQQEQKQQEQKQQEQKQQEQKQQEQKQQEQKQQEQKQQEQKQQEQKQQEQKQQEQKQQEQKQQEQKQQEQKQQEQKQQEQKQQEQKQQEQKQQEQKQQEQKQQEQKQQEQKQQEQQQQQEKETEQYEQDQTKIESCSKPDQTHVDEQYQYQVVPKKAPPISLEPPMSEEKQSSSPSVLTTEMLKNGLNRLRPANQRHLPEKIDPSIEHQAGDDDLRKVLTESRQFNECNRVFQRHSDTPSEADSMSDDLALSSGTDEKLKLTKNQQRQRNKNQEKLRQEREQNRTNKKQVSDSKNSKGVRVTSVKRRQLKLVKSGNISSQQSKPESSEANKIKRSQTRFARSRQGTQKNTEQSSCLDPAQLAKELSIAIADHEQRIATKRPRVRSIDSRESTPVQESESQGLSLFGFNITPENFHKYQKAAEEMTMRDSHGREDSPEGDSDWTDGILAPKWFIQVIKRANEL